MPPRFADVARHLFIILAIPPMVTAWLPLMRSLIDGDSYQWGTSVFGWSFSGAGLGGDFPWLIPLAGIAVTVIYLGWRQPGRNAAFVALAWSGLWLADAAASLLSGREVTFQGATMGVNLSITWISVVYFMVLTVLAGLWAVDGADRPRPEWGAMNTMLLAAAALITAPQYFLLSSAEGQETNDIVGVLLTMVQWVLIAAAMAPWPARRGDSFV